MAATAVLKVVVTGMVQGVMFRDFTRHKAEELGLTGYVRNLPGGRAVEVEAEGERARLEDLLAILKRGPARARVESVLPDWSEYTGKYRDFKIKY
jgi:acylphosphatase